MSEPETTDDAKLLNALDRWAKNNGAIWQVGEYSPETNRGIVVGYGKRRQGVRDVIREFLNQDGRGPK